MTTVIEVETKLPTGTKSPWNRTEAEYVQSYMTNLIRRYQQGIEFEKKQLAELGPKATKAREKPELSIRFWGEVLKDLHDPNSRKYQAEVGTAKKNYGLVVRKAISTGKEVDEDIINSRLEFRTARTARERYEKGRHTSFANRSIAINEQMREEQGFKVKRQDGKEITAEQIKEISAGIDEIEKVLGPLHDLFEKTDITIAHTSGKHPFLTSFGGLYSIHERTVTMGSAGCRALAHEVAHWLDNEAGHATGITGRVYNKTGNKSTVTTSVADKKDQGFSSWLMPTGGEGLNLISKARRNMNDEMTVRRMFKGVGQLKDPQLANIKVHLGAYWNRGSEIWARLVEQYVATKLGEKGAAADSPSYYQGAPGWWDKDVFATMVPEIEAEIKQRVRELRGSDTVPPRHKVTPPATVVRQAEEVVKAMKEEIPDKEWEAQLTKWRTTYHDIKASPVQVFPEDTAEQIAANYDKALQLEEQRPLLARTKDESMSHANMVIAKKLTTRKLRSWKKRPGASDIQDVDSKKPVMPRLSR